ncbi:MAG: trypsin-like peptidase domain-containing protein, partial [Patescibacteria group bacterium]|nr:trypsin-like peptidase domain-containing protein [Patescibacteria group bacterium]
MKKLVVLVVILFLILGIISTAQKLVPTIVQGLQTPQSTQNVKVVSEESVTINAVKKVGPSVVTVEEMSSGSQQQAFNFGPFSIFGIPQNNNDSSQQPVAIGSGFIVGSDGLIVTNKHVVSDTTGTYDVTTFNDKKYSVKKIYRDPLNDIAILKIDPSQNSGNTLTPVPMGDSSHLQVGQFVVAIGTALGEFRNTVTT